MAARLLFAFLFASIPCLAWSQDQSVIDTALTRAVNTFEAALPSLQPTQIGVDVGAYRDALTLGQFASALWGETIRVEVSARAEATGACSRFAAFVRTPPENGTIGLVLCPQFFAEGADALRELTLLHEMVHVVAGPDECRAMAFAAHVQVAATGTFTPVDRYWSANGCEGSQFSLPG